MIDFSIRYDATIPYTPATHPRLHGRLRTVSRAGRTIYDPEVIYSPIPRQYEIAGISVSGVKNVDDYVIIGYSGLNIGEKIDIPGDAITNATKRFWRQGLYSKVRIFVTKTVGDKVWLEIASRSETSAWRSRSRLTSQRKTRS